MKKLLLIFSLMTALLFSACGGGTPTPLVIDGGGGAPTLSAEDDGDEDAPSYPAEDDGDEDTSSYPDEDDDPYGLNGTFTIDSTLPFVPWVEFAGNNFTMVTYWSTWDRGRPLVTGMTITLSRLPSRSATTNERLRYGGYEAIQLTHEGTFSIWGDEIEFVLSDGTVSVLSFSQTGNTVAIGGARFVRN